LSTAFALNALSFFAVVAALLMMKLPINDKVDRRLKKPTGGVWHGIAVVAAHPGMRPLFILIGIFAIMVRPVADLLPAFAAGVFAKGPGGFAALVAAMGAGALCAGGLLSWRQQTTGLTTVLAIFGMIGAIATALFALTANAYSAVALMWLVGMGVTGKNIVAQTMVQSGLDDEVRGRVLSFYAVIFGAAPSGGALILGYIGDLVGIRGPVVVAAMIGLLASFTIFINRKSLARHLEVTAAEPATPPLPSWSGHGAAHP
jgi:predicted MFS family arabinose efflux permease